MAKDTDSDTEKATPFVGFCRLVLVDSDGIFKKTIGSMVQVPIHQTAETEEELTLTCYLPVQDPIRFLRVDDTSQDFLVGIWYYGGAIRPGHYAPQDMTLAELETCSVSAALKSIRDTKEDWTNYSFQARAHCPFSPDAYSSPLSVDIHLLRKRMKTHVEKLTLKVPKKQYDDFMSYYKIIKALKDSKKTDDKDGKQDEAES